MLAVLPGFPIANWLASWPATWPTMLLRIVNGDGKILTKTVNVTSEISGRVWSSELSELVSPMTNDDEFDVRRRASRKIATIKAAIAVAPDADELPCCVRDVSDDGALLELPSAEDVPFRFWLKLDGETAPHFCTVAWRSARHLGIEFSQEITQRRITERRAFAII